MVEKRAFGRTVIVGTHIVSHIMKFAPKEVDEFEDETDNPPKSESLKCKIIGTLLMIMWDNMNVMRVEVFYFSASGRGTVHLVLDHSYSTVHYHVQFLLPILSGTTRAAESQ